jgi:WXG100 family type VII secretion target
MSGKIKVDFGSLSELQSQVNSSAQKILAEIEDIKKTATGTQAYWTGAAQDSFNARYQQLEKGQREVNEAISQFGSLIGRANAAYGDAETKIKGMFAN